jgi:peptidoglycan hydrolase-like protein with peptidoglycan-binding domain
MLHPVRRSRRKSFRLLLAAAAIVVAAISNGPGAASAATPPPASAPSASTVVLRVGDRSLLVAHLQQLLRAAGLAVAGGVDGAYGPGTAAAVRAFQSSRGLPATGTVDRATAVALQLVPATPLLAPGARGDAVVRLQRRLQSVGLRPRGGADGSFGPATVTSVRQFQTAHHLVTSGMLDQATDAVLANAISGNASPPAVTLAHFPLPPTCAFWDTWGAPRLGGRRHEGTDMAAPVGTPIYAVVTGTITQKRLDFPGSRGGNEVWLTAPDGTYFFYGHMNGFARGIAVGSKVAAGQVIGYVGKTGITTVAHLHFEVHPFGGVAVNPYPILAADSHCPGQR